VSVTVDTKGRVRASKEQRRIILAEFERSGVSGAQFAKLTGLKYSTLAGWLQRYRRGKSKSSPSAMRLLEAVVEPATGTSGEKPLALVVELPGGARLEIGDVKQVPLAAVLLRSLHQPC
jgi:transposase-like protein